MNWKAVGVETGKIYATCSHADCSRAVNEGISNIDERANAAINHTEAIRVMREDEYIRSEEEELELIEEKMRLIKEKKHVQLEIKKAALDEERERKRMDAEREKIQKENVRLEAVAKIQAAREAVKAKQVADRKEKQAAEKKAKEPKRMIEKRVYTNEWTTEQDAYLRTNIQEPNDKLIVAFRERFGKELTDSALDNRKYKLRKQYGIPPQKTRITWTAEDDEYLIANYHRMTAEAIGEHLGGRKRAAVWNRVERLKDAGRMDNERYDKAVDYFIQQEAEEVAKEEIAVECAEKMDTIKTIKPEKGDKTAIHMTICKQLNQTYQAKNTDYGDSFSETYRKLGIISAVTRISDKTNRLISLAGKPEAERLVKDESITDTLMDMANYAILTLMELEEAK